MAPEGLCPHALAAPLKAAMATETPEAKVRAPEDATSETLSGIKEPPAKQKEGEGGVREHNSQRSEGGPYSMPLPSTRPIAIMTAGDFTSWGAQMCHVQNIKLRKRPCRQTLRKATAPHRPIPDDITSKKKKKNKKYISEAEGYTAPRAGPPQSCAYTAPQEAMKR